MRMISLKASMAVRLLCKSWGGWKEDRYPSLCYGRLGNHTAKDVRGGKAKPVMSGWTSRTGGRTLCSSLYIDPVASSAAVPRHQCRSPWPPVVMGASINVGTSAHTGVPLKLCFLLTKTISPLALVTELTCWCRDMGYSSRVSSLALYWARDLFW